MVQGTSSDAGKSTLVAGIGRVLARRGCDVVPFKPQNMALNSAVTEDGGEIGRAQAVQALACRVVPSTDMNPILIKPNSDTGAQIIVHGKAIANMEAQFYHQFKAKAMSAVLASYERLRAKHQCILVEGAGSPAEINLRENDIANMGFAEAADCNVILIADIEKGGVFAQLVGTLSLLSESEQARIKGFVINRFRGDIGLLEPGLDWLEKKTGVPVLGVLPYINRFHLEAEDAINQQQNRHENALNVCVPVFPRISNHTDFDPLRLHPDVNLKFIGPDDPISACDLIILPGTKSVRQDYQHLVASGWREQIHKHLRYGGKLLGICGGFQMLGNAIHDPDGIEGNAGSSKTLGIFDCESVLTPQKTLLNVNGFLVSNEQAVSGYEIHAGQTTGPAMAKPFAYLSSHTGEKKSESGYNDGAVSDDQKVIGTYIHGLFESTDTLNTLLQWAGKVSLDNEFNYVQYRENEIERLADVLEDSLNLETLLSLCGAQ